MSGDVLGVIIVYSYVATLILISEKLLKKHPFIGRKFLHIMVGNIFLVLHLFDHAWVMAFVAAAPFIPITFLMSPYSPLKIANKASAAGHGMGLVYYSISWTILAYTFFNYPEVISVGIVAMSYGDGFASIIGRRYGKRKFSIFGDVKSIEGSFAMMLVTLILSVLALIYYGKPIDISVLIVVAFIAMLVEAITPRGMDNLTVSLSTAFIYYLFIYGL